MQDSIYAASSVKALFAQMARTYGVVNLVASLGFAFVWRRQCLSRAVVEPGHVVYDLMTGMGECLPGLTSRNDRAPIVGVDFSPEMCARARETAAGLGPHCRVLEEDVLGSTLADRSGDRITCTFGLKTLTPEGLAALGREVRRVLRPGGRFSFVEIAVPPSRLLRGVFLVYLRLVVPLIGRLFLGNPDNYRRLSVYTKAFDPARVTAAFEESGLEVEQSPLFFGCAVGFTGRPASDNHS